MFQNVKVTPVGGAAHGSQILARREFDVVVKHRKIAFEVNLLGVQFNNRVFDYLVHGVCSHVMHDRRIGDIGQGSAANRCRIFMGQRM